MTADTRTEALTTWTATAVAEAVRVGELSAVDATQEALQRARERDGAIGAYQLLRGDRAIAEAAAVDALVAGGAMLPLAGVPLAIKDNVPVAGEPMRVGSYATDATPQPQDHPVVARLRAAGAVVVGLTRVPELCVYGATDSGFGVTRNPWLPSRTPGGSSGGSAAAVAAGMVPAAHAADGMGSIRIPAAACGLVGIKPGSGVVPADLGTSSWFGLAENGPLATTVADAALVLSVMAGDPGLAQVREPGRIVVALSTKCPVQGVRVDRAYANAAAMAATALAAAGHDVVSADPPYPTSTAIAALSRWFAGTAEEAAELDPSRLEPRVRTHAAIGRLVRRAGLVRESDALAWRDRSGEFLGAYDVLITPALAAPPIEARSWSSGSWAATMAANVRYAPFAAPWNLAGVPAMVVPSGGVHPALGTPLAVQLVARRGSEALLLGVAATLERLRPWQRLAPAYAG